MTPAAGADRNQGGNETASAGLALAMRHPTRFSILVDMWTPFRQMSPSEYAAEKDLPLNHVAYHFRVLSKAGCIKVVKTEPVRGATRHTYEPVKSALAWEKEWDAVGPYIQQTIAASVLRTFVERAGHAIDDGAFNNRPNSHFSFDTMWVDELGFDRLCKLFDGMLRVLLNLKDECNARESKDNPLFLATYAMSSFESPQTLLSSTKT
jgi:hypothetical protein